MRNSVGGSVWNLDDRLLLGAAAAPSVTRRRREFSLLLKESRLTSFRAPRSLRAGIRVLAAKSLSSNFEGDLLAECEVALAKLNK
jgi:hypothetical protein